MSIFADCWGSVRSSWRDCMVTPITKKKALIFAGVVLFVVLFIIVLVVALPSTSVAESDGSTVLTDYPVVLGRSNLPHIINTEFMNQVYTYNSTLQTYISQNLDMNYIGTQLWTVGSSNCSTAEFRDAMPQTMGQIDAIVGLTSLLQNFVLESDVNGITEALDNYKKAGILSLDGGYAIGTRVSALRTYYNLGVRVMAVGGPTSNTSTSESTCSTKWSQTADGNATVGLTDFGKAVIKEMNRLGMAIDLSGSSNQTITDVFNTSSAPVLFTSAGAQQLVTNDNNLSDEQLTLAGNKSALIMVSFDSSQICADQSNCNVTNLIETIEYIANITGRDRVGLGGGSMSYTFSTPDGANTSAGLKELFDSLHDSSIMANPWSLDELKGLSRENFITFMTSVEAIAKEMEDTTPSDLFEPETDLGDNSTAYPCITDWKIFYSTDDSSTTTTTQATTTSATTEAASTTVATTKANTGTTSHS